MHLHKYELYDFIGGISAAVTTPLDVAKTRIMLADRTLFSSELLISNTLYKIYIENGIRGYVPFK